MRIAMISGPPAIPSFRGTGIPGIARGILPKRIPIMIPCLWEDSDPAVIARKLLALYENGCNVGIEQVQQ
jgi:hypothetical protein